MRALTALISIILLMFAAPAHAGEISPDWALRTADGEAVRLSQEVQEQPVVLLFWATWCPYCKALMPHLHSMRLEYGDSIEFLAVHISDPEGDPVGFIEERGYDFTVLLEGDDVAKLYDIYGTPGIIIVDEDRIMRFDLRAVPRREAPEDVASGNHSRKAAYFAPYWAAEIRKSIDRVLATATR